MQNVDQSTVTGFADEWTRFDQRGLSANETHAIFDAYFSIFPWTKLPPDAAGFDAGCGTGRWAALVAPRVGRLVCVDASDRVLQIARQNLAGVSNVVFHCASVASMPIPDGSMDFGYSLGVLHHMPDVQSAISACAQKLKPSAPFLVYLYYAFDNRPAWFRAIWRVSDVMRRGISRMPRRLRFMTADALALFVYWPFSRGARVLEALGAKVDGLPLAIYRDRSFYVLRNDALDRFGTRLERRFRRDDIRCMLEAAGFTAVTFSDAPPFWCAVAYRRAADAVH